jgi:FkbM family methyltransferase
MLNKQSRVARIILFPLFVIRNNGINFDTVKAVSIWLWTNISKKIGLWNKNIIKWWSYSANLKIDGISIKCRTGHIGLIEEIFFQRKINVCENKDIIDCGANIGLFSLYVKKNFKVKSIYCIEPDPANIILLKKNIEQNQPDSVNLLECAVGDKKGICSFISTDNGVGSYLGEKVLKKNEKLITVNVDTLDNLVADNKIRPGFIKIDVEGFELQALSGAKKTLKKFHPELLVEIHKKEYYAAAEKYLKGLGYTVFKRVYGDAMACR